MKRVMKRMMLWAAAATMLCASQMAMANTYTYEFTWSGNNPYGPERSDAVASATVVVQAPTVDYLVNQGQVLSLSMTVQGSGVGDGVYTKSDYVLFEVPYRNVPELVLNQRYELSSWDVLGITFISNGNGAPSNFAIDKMFTGPATFPWGGPDSTTLYLASKYVTWTDTVAVVPEPETYAMLLGGLGLIGVAARKRRRTQGMSA